VDPSEGEGVDGEEEGDVGDEGGVAVEEPGAEDDLLGVDAEDGVEEADGEEEEGAFEEEAEGGDFVGDGVDRVEDGGEADHDGEGDGGGEEDAGELAGEGFPIPERAVGEAFAEEEGEEEGEADDAEDGDEESADGCVGSAEPARGVEAIAEVDEARDEPVKSDEFDGEVDAEEGSRGGGWGGVAGRHGGMVGGRRRPEDGGSGVVVRRAGGGVVGRGGIDGAGVVQFGAGAREGVRLLAFEVIDEGFACFAAEVPEFAGVARAEERAELDGVFGDVGDDDLLDAAVPARVVFDGGVEMFAEAVDVDGVVGVDEDGAEELGRGACPVLEGFVDDLRERDDESSFVPDTDDDVGGGEFFDASPFAVDDDDVVDADGLGECDLEAGDERREGRLCGEADDDAGDAGGREEREADGADFGEGCERGAGAEDDDDDLESAFDDACLRVDAASGEVVFDVETIAGHDGGGGEADAEDEGVCDGEDGGDEDEASEPELPCFAECGVLLGEGEGDADEDEGERGPEGFAESGDDVAHDGELVGVAFGEAGDDDEEDVVEYGTEGGGGEEPEGDDAEVDESWCGDVGPPGGVAKQRLGWDELVAWGCAGFGGCRVGRRRRGCWGGVGSVHGTEPSGRQSGHLDSSPARWGRLRRVASGARRRLGEFASARTPRLDGDRRCPTPRRRQ